MNQLARWRQVAFPATLVATLTLGLCGLVALLGPTRAERLFRRLGGVIISLVRERLEVVIIVAVAAFLLVWLFIAVQSWRESRKSE